MNRSPESLRGVAAVVLDLLEEWLNLDRHTLKLMMELAGTLPTLSDINKGLESLYLSEPVIDGYTTNQAAPAAESILLELEDALEAFSDILTRSMRLQMQSLSISSAVSSDDPSACVSVLDLAIIVDSIHTMMLREFDVRDTIIRDLKVEMVPETLAMYITTVKAQPFIDDALIAQYKNKIALYDQLIGSRLKVSS